MYQFLLNTTLVVVLVQLFPDLNSERIQSQFCLTLTTVGLTMEANHHSKLIFSENSTKENYCIKPYIECHIFSQQYYDQSVLIFSLYIFCKLEIARFIEYA